MEICSCSTDHPPSHGMSRSARHAKPRHMVPLLTILWPLLTILCPPLAFAHHPLSSSGFCSPSSVLLSPLLTILIPSLASDHRPLSSFRLCVHPCQYCVHPCWMRMSGGGDRSRFNYVNTTPPASQNSVQYNTFLFQSDLAGYNN